MPIATRSLLICALVSAIGSALGIQFRPLHCSSKQYVLLTDTGVAVSRCPRCFPGAKVPDALVARDSHGIVTAKMVWTMCWWGSGKMMLKAPDTDRFLARCHNCYENATDADAAFAFADRYSLAAQWTLEVIKQQVEGNIVAFKADSGKYLARCRGCVKDHGDIDSLFVHATSSDAKHVQFQLVELFK